MEATLLWKKGRPKKIFRLSSKDGLQSHYRPRGQWLSDEEKHLESSFAKRKTDWVLKRAATVFALRDNRVLVSDYQLHHPNGFVVNVEVIGYWRAEYLRRRLEDLSELNAPLILVVGERLKLDKNALEESAAHVVFFKGVIPIKALLLAADRLREERAHVAE